MAKLASKTACLASQAILKTQDNFMAPYFSNQIPDSEGSLGEYATKAFKSPALYFDIIVTFQFGDFSTPITPYSTYFDPKSDWYNGYYGSYSLRSYKANKAAIGFSDLEGKVVDLDDLATVFELDYNFLTGNRLGCPPELFCAETTEKSSKYYGNGWFECNFAGIIPSCLYEPKKYAFGVDPTYSLLFGIPNVTLLNQNNLTSYSPTKIRGTLYLKQVAPQLSIYAGSIFLDTEGGAKLKEQTLAKMRTAFNIVPEP